MLDEAFTRQQVGAVAGQHVMLAVMEEGVGIDPASAPAWRVRDVLDAKRPGRKAESRAAG